MKVVVQNGDSVASFRNGLLFWVLRKDSVLENELGIFQN